VPQPLVVHNTAEDIRGEFLARDARVHGLVAVEIVARGAELFAEIFARGVLLAEAPGGGVLS